LLKIENRIPIGRSLRSLEKKPRFTVFGWGDRLFIEGQDRFAEAKVADRTFIFPMQGFFQSNIAMLEKLIESQILPLQGTSALDLYSGAGLFSRFLAERFTTVECVESDEVSVEAARRNTQLTKLQGANKGRAKVHFSAMPVERWIRSTAANSAYDCILADPPRTGLSATVRTWLSRCHTHRLIYVSCDHASLARDLGELLNSEWRLDSLSALSIFIRRPGGSKRLHSS